MTFRNIYNEWHSEFPALSKYSERTLFMRLNPFLIGLRFSKAWPGKEYYVLCFEIIPLWEEDSKLFGRPLCYENLKVGKACSAIEYKRHNLYFKEALECTKSQFGNILKKEVSFRNLMNQISKITKYNPYDWIDTFQLQLGLAMYFNRQDILEIIKKSITEEIWHWVNKPKVDINNKTISAEEWRKKIYRGLEDRNKFMETIEMNCQRPKVTKLNVGHIIGVDEYTVDEYTKEETHQSWRDRLFSFFFK